MAKQREMEQEKAAACGRERAANQVLRESTLFRRCDGCIVIVMRESLACCGIIAEGPRRANAATALYDAHTQVVNICVNNQARRRACCAFDVRRATNTKNTKKKRFIISRMHRDVGALFTFGETVYVPDGIWAGEGGSKSAREQQHFENYLLACASERARDA